ncbi:MAG: hypothetical protein WD077_02675 [Bacteroidia bacterium]
MALKVIAKWLRSGSFREGVSLYEHFGPGGYLLELFRNGEA